MGILDKLKGLVKGREDQVKTGIDKVSDTAEKQGAGRTPTRSTIVSDKAKDAVDNLAKDTPADPAPPTASPRRLPPPRRPRQPSPDADEERDPVSRSSCGAVAVSQSVPVSLSFTLSTASLTLPAP